MPTPYDKASSIFSAHLPEVGRANTILADRFPGTARGNKVLADAGLFARGPGGGVRRPGLPPTVDQMGPQVAARSPLATAIAQNAAAVAQAGGVVDINVWAGSLGRAGVSAEVIRGAYDGAGGDATLSAQESRGETSQFLGAFVQGLEDQGVAPEVVVGTYQEAGGRLGDGSGPEKGTAGGLGSGSREEPGPGSSGGAGGRHSRGGTLGMWANKAKGLFGF